MKVDTTAGSKCVPAQRPILDIGVFARAGVLRRLARDLGVGQHVVVLVGRDRAVCVRDCGEVAVAVPSAKSSE